MSNRILGILIFVIFGTLVFIYFHFFQVKNGIILEIISNEGDYEIELYLQKSNEKTIYNCVDINCELTVNEGNYVYTAEKKGFSAIKGYLEVDRKVFEHDLHLNFEKTVILEKISSEKKIVPIEKIRAIKNKKSYLADLGFKESDSIVYNVNGNKHIVFIKNKQDFYSYNLQTNQVKKIDFGVDVLYIKSGFDNFEFLIVTDIGTYLYSTIEGTMTYFTFFNDFIYHNSGYLGFISKNESVKLKNLGLESETMNLIVNYNPNTKEKQVIYRMDFTPMKILKIDDKIHIYDNQGGEYVLENF